MSTFKLPDFPVAVPATVKKPPVKVSAPQPNQPAPQKSLQSLTSALPTAQPMAPSENLETRFEPGVPDERWGMDRSSSSQFTVSNLLGGDREIWAKGVILAMILGKPRCKNRGWR